MSKGTLAMAFVTTIVVLILYAAFGWSNGIILLPFIGLTVDVYSEYFRNKTKESVDNDY